MSGIIKTLPFIRIIQTIPLYRHMKLTRWINSLPVLPRFLIEMVVGAVVFMIYFFCVLFTVLRESYGFTVAVGIEDCFFFWNSPPLMLYESITNLMQIQNKYIGDAFFGCILLVLLYNGFLFALFCEGIRFVVKRWRK